MGPLARGSFKYLYKETTTITGASRLNTGSTNRIEEAPISHTEYIFHHNYLHCSLHWYMATGWGSCPFTAAHYTR